MNINPIHEHISATKNLALSLNKRDIYYWLIQYGYFPENYILPPCFTVSKIPTEAKIYYKVKKNKYAPDRTEYIKVHFPKTELTDRTFGIIHPQIHNDIAFHIAQNWKTILKPIFSPKNQVASYSFPIPIDAETPGRISYLRSGRMIYEFIHMIDDDIASLAYQYNYILKADIKNFYPSIYTHSISWALHGKKTIKKPSNMHNYSFVGNRLDKLFQNANDGCTNGIPIGPVVSDIIAEVIASAIDIDLSKRVSDASIDCQLIRFKDDYRILVKDESDAKSIVKFLQASLKEFNLELSDEKTHISTLPDGLFREWVSKYHAVHPRKQKKYSWKQFRELYLSVIRIDKEYKGTGVIDRFLADIISKDGALKVDVDLFNLQKVISMLLMLASLRVKAFPKIIAILETILNSDFGFIHQSLIAEYLDSYLIKLSKEEERNKYLISWISYFIVSNNLESYLTAKPKLKDPITRSILNNRGNIFKHAKEFKLFTGSKTVSKKITLLEHLDVFNPPEPTT